MSREPIAPAIANASQGNRKTSPAPETEAEAATEAAAERLTNYPRGDSSPHRLVSNARDSDVMVSATRIDEATDLQVIEHLDFDPAIPCESGDDCRRIAHVLVAGTEHYVHRIGTPPPPLPLCIECYEFRANVIGRAPGMHLQCPCGVVGHLFPTFVHIVEWLR